MKIEKIVKGLMIVIVVVAFLLVAGTVLLVRSCAEAVEDGTFARGAGSLVNEFNEAKDGEER